MNALLLDRPLALRRSTGTMALAAVFCAALTALGGAISFPLPFSPVPVTLQTLFVVLAGVMLGPIWGPASMLLYLTAGISGMPVFAGGAAGPGVLLGPTGGYLAGFVVGAWTAGLLARPGSSWVRLGTALLAAHAVVLLFGVTQLKIYTGNDLGTAIALGVTPFLPGLAAKLAVSVALLRSRALTGWFRP